MRYLLFLLSYFCFFDAFGQTKEWKPTSFPVNNTVFFISALDDALFAGSQEGLFRSLDQGETWENLTEKDKVRAVNTLLSEGGTYYIASWTQGVFKSSDLKNWAPVGEGLPNIVSCLSWYDKSLFAGTANAVYIYDADSNKWLPDGLKIKNIHNQYILDMKPNQGKLYAAGCDYLYERDKKEWTLIDTNYRYCGGKIRQMGAQLILNTTGAGLQKMDSLSGKNIVQSVVADRQDSLSRSAADFIYFAKELFVLSRHNIYYVNGDSSEMVCDDILSSIEIAYNNIFVGTRQKGIWKRYWDKHERPNAEDRSAIAPTLDFEVYPTPSNGQMMANFKLQGNATGYLMILDEAGRMILEQHVPGSGNQPIFLLESGTYLAVLTDGKQKIPKKIIVQ